MIKKHRIIKKFIRNKKSGEIEHYFTVESLEKWRTFFRKREMQMWVECTERCGYGGYDWTQVRVWKTQKEAEKFIDNMIVEIPQREIICYPKRTPIC